MAKEDVTPVGPDLIEEICSDMTMKLTEKIGEGSLLSTITQFNRYLLSDCTQRN